MTNVFILVGKIKEIKESGLVLEVNTPNKEPVRVEVQVGEDLAQKTSEFIEVGISAGVKGYFDDGNVLVAEKLTFISSGKRRVNKNEYEKYIAIERKDK